MPLVSSERKPPDEKTVADRDTHAEPEHSFSNGKRSRNVTYFRCTGCGFEFSLPDTVYEDEPYSSNCLECNRPISIQTVQSQSSMDVIELFGCEYGRRGLDVTTPPLEPPSSEQILSWIKDHTEDAQAEIRPDTFTNKETFIDAFVSKWVVVNCKGKKFEFDYFSALRKAIEGGRVGPKDKILASDGKEYEVSEYPGTADLFGNGSLQLKVRSGLSAAHEGGALSWQNVVNTAYRVVMVLFVAASLASTAYWGPKYYLKWQQLQGEQLVADLTAGLSVRSNETFESVFRNGLRMLRTADPELLSDAVHQFEKALAVRPHSVEVMSALAESLADLGGLTSDRLDLANAQKLVRYAKTLDPKAPETARAEARFLWRTGRTREAIDLMKSQPEAFFINTGNVYLLARMEMDAQDYNQATLHLNQALGVEPSNVVFLTSFSELNERQGKFSQAALYLEKAQVVSGDPWAFTEQLADLYTKGGESEAAAQVYRNAIRRGEVTEKNYLGLVRALVGAGKHQETVTAGLQYLSNFPDGAHAEEVQTAYKTALTIVNPAAISDSDQGTSRRRHRSSRP